MEFLDTTQVRRDFQDCCDIVMKGNNDQAAILETGVRMLKTVLQKNHDYGSAVFQPPMIDTTLTADAAIKVRISDKLGRLKTLAGADALVDESLNDTIFDLFGYFFLWYVLRTAIQPLENPGPPDDEVPY